MSKTVKTNMKTGFITFTFSDENDEVFASFKMNPTDPRMEKRCKNIAGFFSELSKDLSSYTVQDYESAVEDKFCQFLGYDCRASLFSRIAATNILPDGRIFASHILDAIIKNVGPEIRKRRQEHIARYTKRYEK